MIDVVAGVIRKGETVLIARRAPHKSLPGKWEFPGGKVEEGEDPRTALERELFEEFGIRTRVGDFITSTEHVYPNLKIRLISYLTDYVSGEFTLTDHDKIKWVQLTQLTEYDLAEADLPIIIKLETIL